MAESIRVCADRIRRARERGASVILFYGAHLLRNGAALILDSDDGGRLADPPGHQWRRDDP